jgi:hypothetical protein
MQQYNCDNGACRYGVEWTDPDTYSGKTYPDSETEYVFSQAEKEMTEDIIMTSNTGGPRQVSIIFVLVSESTLVQSLARVT